MSIVLGVTHMMFGVCLSFFNHRHFKKPLDIVAEFIPQVCVVGIQYSAEFVPLNIKALA